MDNKIKIFLIFLITCALLFFIFNDEIKNILKDNKMFSKERVEKLNIKSGIVKFSNKDNQVIHGISNVLFNGDLLAIPTRTFINGSKWSFNLNDKSYEIKNGYWETGDVIGLWKIDKLKKNNRSDLKLVSWKRNKKIIWLSLNNLNKKVQINKIKKTRRFDSAEIFTLPENINSAGIFLQDNNLVGWTFDSLLPYGILWSDEKDEFLEKKISYRNIYNNYCVNGQEYNFNKALLLEDDSAKKLELLVQSVMLPRRFKKINRNEELNRTDLLNEIHMTADALLKDGNWRGVKNYLTFKAVIECDDTAIFDDAFDAAQKNNKYLAPIKFLDDIIASKDPSGKLKDLATGKYVKLGIVHINDLIKKGNNSDALTLFNKLYAKTKTNPEVNINGVKLLIWLNDWVGAEHLLYSIHYPSKYNTQLAELKNELDNLKKEVENEDKDYYDNKTVVNFPIGTKGININAVINDFTPQEFLLDTGASMTTLPKSTLEELGVHVMMDSPEHRVSTAGGVISAREVHIDSISLQNCRVENLNVLALDLPGQSGKGLLGMNFLKHFHIEINHEKGTLTLVPKDE
jgi:clan AA aspartic protease (TIGR02281 family)